MFSEFKQYQSSNISSVKAYGLSSDEGQFRCTDSSIVHSSSECPLTDQCPASNEEINLVQCTLKSSQTENEQDTVKVFSNCSNRLKSSSLSSDCPKSRHSSNTYNYNSNNGAYNLVPISKQNSMELTISTDKKIYAAGEIVNITIINAGNQPLSFSGPDTNMKIRNLNTSQTYSPSSMPGKLVLDSGASKRFPWNQLNSTGMQVDSGNYRASVSMGLLSANATFSISQN